MSWFIFSVLCLFAWGTADLFYKKGSDESDRYSHLKIAVCVGLVMGAAAFICMPFSESIHGLNSLFSGMVSYLPASLCYIISMIIGYAGLRYLELSIASPVQNASGAFSMVVMIFAFLFFRRKDSIPEFSLLDILGTILIVAGMIGLAIAEQKLAQREKGESIKAEERKYRYGALALIFPVLYCVFDTLGTAADGLILDPEIGIGLGEIDVMIVYGLTFFIVGAVCEIILFVKEKNIYNSFIKAERDKLTAAVFEEAGQIFYIYAMADNPVMAAPVVASYCVFSIILSHLILKEKLDKSRYGCIITVILGIILLGISEGLAEL